jgi:hypothetical protein
VGVAVDGAVGGAVRDAVHGAVGDAVGGAVRDAVRDAVHGAVGDAVDGAVGGAVGGAVRTAVLDNFWKYFGGQFWVGWGWYWGPSSVSFYLDELRLDIGREMELRARAFAATHHACWWWPGRDFVIVSERPRRIELYPGGKLRLVEWEGWKVER